MHIVIFSGGKFVDTPLSQKAIKKADMIIAADGGAVSALKVQSTPDVVIGDFDSIPENILRKLKKKHVEFVKFKEEKDETDTELALQHAIKLGATKITLLGGVEGNRIDHILANILLATIFDVSLVFIQRNQVSFVTKGQSTVKLFGSKGDLLSLIPLLGNATGITTKNLKYKLKNETLIFGRPRGISNVFLKEKAEISVKQGMLFVVHTLQLTS